MREAGRQVGEGGAEGTPVFRHHWMDMVGSELEAGARGQFPWGWHSSPRESWALKKKKILCLSESKLQLFP